MMTKTVFLAALGTLLISSRVDQTNYVESYYPSINKAEASIIEGKLAESIEHYDAAFARVEIARSVDLYNSLVCHIIVGQEDISYELNQLCALGVSMGKLQKQLDLLEFQLPGFVDSMKCTKVMDQLDIALKFEDIKFKDQFIRTFRYQNAALNEKIKKIDSINVLQLKALIEEYGFPGERLFGTSKVTNDFPVSIVLIHYFNYLSKDSTKVDVFHEDCVTAINQGHLDPYKWADIYEYKEKNQPFKLASQGLTEFRSGNESKLFREAVDSLDLGEIDSVRASFGLCSYEDYYKRARFALQVDTASIFNFIRYKSKRAIDLPKEFYNSITQDLSDWELK